MSDANGNTAPAPARQASRPPLRRPREGRVLAGVAAGIADHLGMDVAIVRLLIVVAVFVTSGFGVLVYIAAIFVIPEADEHEEQAAEVARASRAGSSDSGRDPAFWAGVALLVVGVLWVLGGVLGSVSVFPGRVFPNLFVRDLLWPLVLIGFGLALWKASDRRAAPPGTPTATPPPPAGGPVAPPPAPPAMPTTDPDETTMTTQRTARLDAPSPTTERLDPTPPPAGGGAAAVPGGEQPDGGTPPPPDVTGQPPGAGGGWTPPERRQPSLLTRVTLGATLVTVGVLWLLRMADVLTLGTSRLISAALLVIGIGLLIGSWFGRGRWLILVGGLLLPVVLLAELLRPFGVVDLPAADVRGGFGELHVSPADLSELRSSYQVGAGSLRLDLSDLEIDEPTDLSIQVGAGEAWVYLPPDVTADVTGRVGVGELSIDDRTSTGLGVPERHVRIEHGEGSEVLTLDISVGFGEATVDVPTWTTDAETERSEPGSGPTGDDDAIARTGEADPGEPSSAPAHPDDSPLVLSR